MAGRSTMNGIAVVSGDRGNLIADLLRDRGVAVVVRGAGQLPGSQALSAPMARAWKSRTITRVHSICNYAASGRRSGRSRRSREKTPSATMTRRHRERGRCSYLREKSSCLQLWRQTTPGISGEQLWHVFHITFTRESSICNYAG
jgi:hypothetical protein